MEISTKKSIIFSKYEKFNYLVFQKFMNNQRRVGTTNRFVKKFTMKLYLNSVFIAAQRIA